MNIPTWLPFFKRNEEDDNPPAPKPDERGFGPLTGRRLSELESLYRPFTADPFYRLRPPFSHRAAELSLELAQMSYSLDIEPWREAGWNDFSIQIDDTLQSGLTHGESATGERMQAIMNAWKLHRAKTTLREANPVAQIMSAMRQKERSDTIKAVCMMHSLDGGKYLLAIGFMGTGKRLYDWISNFRFTTEEGFHKGFYQLCTYFEQGAEQIVFPATAQALGLEKLTLGEVLSEMGSANSRFRLWMAGHSQGGAVMQVFTHRLLTQWGVQPQNIVGYGFASPTVATGAFVYDPASYPLYHILNSDDMVPRMGALVHLGLCMNYPADDEIRKATYDLSALPIDAAVRDALEPYSRKFNDVRDFLVYGAAFIKVLAEEKGEETLLSWMEKPWSLPFVDRVLSRAGDKAMDWTSSFERYMRQSYQDLTGEAMEEATVALLAEQMRPLVRDIPFRRLMGGLASYIVPPHHIACRNGDGAYAYIVKKDLDALQPFIWVKQKNGLPFKRFANVPVQALRGETVQTPVIKRRARPEAARRRQPQGVRRIGYSSQRANKAR
ncbi:MAG: hypothetical protein PHI98_16470 [Eubacteriales bacterium]|nr:hypothetical protein [Eubacteriales bacterium]